MAIKLTKVRVLVRGVKRARWVKVEAQYWRIVDGALCFRNADPEGGYPLTVAVFAPGHWMEIKREH